MQHFSLDNCSAIVVGGATGLGRVATHAFLDAGARVMVGSRNSDRIQTLVTEWQATYNGRLLGHEIDVTRADSVDGFFRVAAREFGEKCNICVYAAGTNTRNALQDIRDDEFKSIVETNLTGAFRTAKAAQPLLAAAEFGRLIGITSIFSTVSFPLRTSYASSKGGLLQLYKTLALEWANSNVTVNTISPGPFMTEINQPVLANPEAYRKFCERIPKGRFGDPKEIATAMLFLAARGSSYVTGANIAIDGGWTAS